MDQTPAGQRLAPEDAAHRRTYRLLVAGSFGLVGVLYFLADSLRALVVPTHHYVALHTVLEVLSVVVAFAIFAVHWNAARHRELADRRALFLGAAFLAIAALDVLHTTTYRGMPGVFGEEGNPDRAIHYWLASRYLLVLALLAVEAIPRRSDHRLLSRPVLLGAATAVVGAVVLSDVWWVRRGVYFVDGAGLTPLKVGLEHGYIALAGLGCLLYLRRRSRRGEAGERTGQAIAAALAITVATGLCFTLYTSVSDTFNLVGHGLKVVASYLIFEALFVSALLRPYAALDATSRDLARSNRELEALRRHVEGELAETIARLEERTAAERVAKERAEATAQDRARLLAELEATLASIPDPLIVYDAGGELVRVNGPALKLLGYGPADIGRPAVERWNDLHIADADGRPVPPEETPMARGLRGERVTGMLLRIEPRPGEVRWVSASAAPIAGPGTRPMGAVLSFPDVTAVREEEAHREDLLRTVSHDLRSPLAAMRLQAQRLHRTLAKIETPDGTTRGLDAIVRAADRMSRMIEDLVDSERLSAGKLAVDARPVDLREQLLELTEGSTAGIDAARLDLELPADLPPALGDPARIDRILTNLLTNAFKYSPETERVRVGAAARERELELWVEDRGHGIPAEDQNRIFHRYFRARNTRADGLGLGLFITRMLVEAHGGRISLTSHPGEGTTFRFTLPRAPAAYGSGANAEG